MCRAPCACRSISIPTPSCERFAAQDSCPACLQAPIPCGSNASRFSGGVSSSEKPFYFKGSGPFSRGVGDEITVAQEATGPASLAGRYASALFDLADQAKALDAVAGDLTSLRTMIGVSDD